MARHREQPVGVSGSRPFKSRLLAITSTTNATSKTSAGLAGRKTAKPVVRQDKAAG